MKAVIEVKKLGEQGYETWLTIGVQGFRVANLSEDEEAHYHCVFIAQQLHHALGELGIEAVCEGFELRADRAPVTRTQERDALQEVLLGQRSREAALQVLMPLMKPGRNLGWGLRKMGTDLVGLGHFLIAAGERELAKR